MNPSPRGFHALALSTAVLAAALSSARAAPPGPASPPQASSPTAPTVDQAFSPHRTAPLDLSAGLGALRAPTFEGAPWADGLPVAPPVARKDGTVDTLLDVRVADPYRWLEDPHRPETRAWVKGQNRATEAYLRRGPERRVARRRLARLLDYERYGIPRRVAGGRYAFERNEGLQLQSILYVSDSLYGKPRALLDPREFSKQGTAAIPAYSFSPDGKRLAYQVQRKGSDWAEVRVRDVDTGRDLPDRLSGSFSGRSVVWRPDGSGVFYARFKEPTRDGKYTEPKRRLGTYFHALGSRQDADVFIGMGDVRTTQDRRTLLLGDGTSRLTLKTLEGPATGSVTLAEGASPDSQFDFVGEADGWFYVATNEAAARNRLVAIDPKAPRRADWKEILPESAEVLSNAAILQGRLLAVWSAPGRDRLKLYDLRGAAQGEIALPGPGTVVALRNWRPGFLLYAFTSFTQPTTTYRYNLATGKSTPYRPPRPSFDPADYVTTQVTYLSKDGTRIPMDLVHRKTLRRDGENPTYLHGYGGFGISMESSWDSAQIAWLDLGGLYALAHLRGGGEYGQAWHDAGRLGNKQNVFDDFIAAAEWLIDQKYTSPARLGIGGGSNGGLLVSAVLTQRPELFGAAVPEVGVHDMLRFHRFTVGRGWVDDYGDPLDRPDLLNLLRYSPLHQVQPGRSYPPTLVMTADHDDRVVPSHSHKLAATLQAAQGWPGPVLLRTQKDAGHGSGRSVTQRISEESDRIAFLLKALGGLLSPSKRN